MAPGTEFACDFYAAAARRCAFFLLIYLQFGNMIHKKNLLANPIVWDPPVMPT